MSDCLKCGFDVSKLMNWNTLTEEYIICPSCNNKMEVCYDESYDPETEDEESWWWLEQYKED